MLNEVYMKKKKVYTAKEKTEALDAVTKGLAVGEVSKLTGIPLGTLYTWKKTPAGDGLAHVCKICGRSFTSGKGLGGHMSSHAGGHNHHQAARDKSIAQLQRSDLVEIVRQVVLVEMEKVADKLKVLPAVPPKITVDEFIQLLRGLITDNAKMHEDLNRQKKLAEDWQIRAGTALEQAQNAIREMNR